MGIIPTWSLKKGFGLCFTIQCYARKSMLNSKTIQNENKHQNEWGYTYIYFATLLDRWLVIDDRCHIKKERFESFAFESFSFDLEGFWKDFSKDYIRKLLFAVWVENFKRTTGPDQVKFSNYFDYRTGPRKFYRFFNFAESLGNSNWCNPTRLPKGVWSSELRATWIID